MENDKKNAVRIFDEKQIRGIWDAEAEKWWFSVVDIIGILTEQPTQRGSTLYWGKLKQRLKAEGSELLTKCQQLKMQAADGKNYKTDTLDTEGVLRLVQSVPSPKAEPFKVWLAKVGSERLDEAVNPELTIERAVHDYRRLGYSENWINQRIKSIEVRKALTDEWDKSGVQQGTEYAKLTDLMSRTWSGMTTKQYKQYKGLTKENLRDHMTNTELVLNMLAEVAATDISIVRQPQSFEESKAVAKEGAETAKAARLRLEKSTGKRVVSKLNARDLKRLSPTGDGGGNLPLTSDIDTDDDGDGNK
jgi:hypothetical protein